MTARSNDHRTASPSSDSGVLSLDALVSATADVRSTQRARLATTIEDPSSSGVIDLDALVRGDDAPTPLTSARHRLVTPSVEPPTNAPSPRFLYSAVGVLSGALLTLGFLAMQSPTTIVVERDAPAPTAELAVAELAADPTEGDTVAVASEPAPPVSESPSERAVDVGPPMPTPPTSTKAKAKSTKTKSTKAKSTKTASKPSTQAPSKVAVTPKPKASKAGDTNVECILDPASCKSPTAKSTSKPAPAPTPTSSRPEKLSSTALRNGLAKPKAAAKVCGSMHAVPAGTKVQVKLSISGATGKVTSATPLPPFNNTVGRCVADRLSDATFEPFTKPAMGVVYSVRM